MEYRFRRATKEDAHQILALYKSVIGTPYCAWTDTYPGPQEIQYDLSREALFCLWDGENLAGVITVDRDEQVEQLDCWSKELAPSVELSRLGVNPAYQNQGLACEMIRKVMNILKSEGKKSIHYLVAKQNVKAIRSYEKLNPNIVGESDLFMTDWWCCEIPL